MNRAFQKGGEERTHHVHVFPAGRERIARHIAFKEYLIAIARWQRHTAA
ncbi:GrpB family protein [Saccharococcus thermophilus]